MLNAGGRGLIFLGDRGVEYFCDGIYDVAVPHRHQYRGTQILISLDVRRNADLVYDLCDLRFNVGGAILIDCLSSLSLCRTCAGYALYVVGKAVAVNGLQQAKLRPGVHCFDEYVLT